MARTEFLKYRTWTKQVFLSLGRIQSENDLVIIKENGDIDNPENFTKR